jgi:RhtB (resistance to homoserine/threonine) family protein
MDLIQGLLVVTTIHFLAAASPGPDFVLVSQQTLTKGKKSGLLCSLGIALGLSIHIIYSALGLAAVIAHSEFWLWVIKLIGGCYLIYIGFKGITAKRAQNHSPESMVITTDSANDTNTTTTESALKTISTGFVCNALNPKAPIYFVSLFTLVLSPNLPTLHLVIYGVWMMAIQLIWFSSVVFLLSRPAINNRFQQMGHWVDRVMGTAMIILGLKVLATKAN